MSKFLFLSAYSITPEGKIIDPAGNILTAINQYWHTTFKFGALVSKPELKFTVKQNSNKYLEQ